MVNWGEKTRKDQVITVFVILVVGLYIWGIASQTNLEDDLDERAITFIMCKKYSNEDLRLIGYNDREQCKNLHERLYMQEIDRCVDKYHKDDKIKDKCLINWVDNQEIDIEYELKYKKD